MHPLLAYALLYMANWPQSEVRALPGPEDEAVTAFLRDPEWYCRKFPGRNVITFFSWVEPFQQGSTATYSVDLDTQSVSKFLT